MVLYQCQSIIKSGEMLDRHRQNNVCKLYKLMALGKKVMVLSYQIYSTTALLDKMSTKHGKLVFMPSELYRILTDTFRSYKLCVRQYFFTDYS